MAVMAMNLMMDCSTFVQQKSPVNTAIVDSGIVVKNVQIKIKNVKKRKNVSKYKKNVCKRNKKRYLFLV